MKKIADRRIRGRRQSTSASVRPVNESLTNSNRRALNKSTPNMEPDLNSSWNRGRPVPSTSRFSFSHNDLSSSTTSQPVYYPKYPQSLSESSRDPLYQTMSPIAPLHPPWRSQLPPNNRQTSELDK